MLPMLAAQCVLLKHCIRECAQFVKNRNTFYIRDRGRPNDTYYKNVCAAFIAYAFS
jgi:hypothetical protein